APRVLPIGADTAHDGGQVQHEIGPVAREHALDVGFTEQIELRPARRNHTLVTGLAQSAHHMPAEETVAPRNENCSLLPCRHRSAPSIICFSQVASVRIWKSR